MGWVGRVMLEGVFVQFLVRQTLRVNPARKPKPDYRNSTSTKGNNQGVVVEERQDFSWSMHLVLELVQIE